MCGFTGFLNAGNLYDEKSQKVILSKMTNALNHRGPDDTGYWSSKEEGISFGHKRLSILDLSEAGHQPMISGSGRYVIAFNGEIYNHLDLRDILESSNKNLIWKGSSDTETLLACFDSWGIEETIKKTVGMFAFALWCNKSRTLTLGRDRLGEKPLYYGWQGKGNSRVFLFGSELKALNNHPSLEGVIDRNAVCLYLRHNSIPAPYSIYSGISKLLPGTLLNISYEDQNPKIVTYWSAASAALESEEEDFKFDKASLVDNLESLLSKTVKQQMLSDVPLGAFLSGGVDSSTIVSLMQAQSTNKISTFTIGFNEEGYNEAKYAKNVANYLGTDHTELYVTANEALKVIPDLPNIYDEPFSDSSQIPTILVSKLASEKVTVSLSGDGGDEIFCGYNRYKIAENYWNNIRRIPLTSRNLISKAMLRVPPKFWDSLCSLFLSKENFGNKIHKTAYALKSKGVDDLYMNLVSHWMNPSEIVINGVEPESVLSNNLSLFDEVDAVKAMMILDQMTYLPDDILTKVDRAAMSSSLETRVPFLDHRIVEFAGKIPQEYKIKRGQSKWALRQVLYRYVPKELIERPKEGFAVPIDKWLRTSLRDWAEDLLDPSLMNKEGIFNNHDIQQKWQEHLSEEYNWQYLLWDILMFQSWLREIKNQ